MPVKEARIDARPAEQALVSLCGAPPLAHRTTLFAGAGPAPPACRDLTLDILVELGQDSHHPIDREATELCIADARKIRSRYSGHLLGFPDGDLLIVQNADDLGGKNCLELKHLGIGVPEVAEHVAAPTDKLKFVVTVGHRSSAFSKFESYRAVHKGLDCFGATRLAMTSHRRHCEPKVKQSSVRGQLIGFMESLQ
jgi:hypothetical protein